MTPGVIGAIASRHRALGGPTVYWSTTDKNADMVVSGDTKSTWRGTSGATHVLTRGVTGLNTGKRYVEFYSPQARGQVPGQGVIAGLVTAAYALSGSAPGEAPGGVGVQFRRYVSAGDSAFFLRNATSASLYFDVALTTGSVGFAVDMATGNIWINIDGAWLSSLSPASSPGTGYTTVPAAGAVYPAVSTYYPLATYPDNSVTLRVLASEMSIGASAFNTGQSLDGFLPWGA
jgi:hypothetical protein